MCRPLRDRAHFRGMIGVAASTAGKKKTGRKPRKHNSPGVRRVSMASAMALMVFAACIDNAAPAGAALDL